MIYYLYYLYILQQNRIPGIFTNLDHINKILDEVKLFLLIKYFTLIDKLFYLKFIFKG